MSKWIAEFELEDGDTMPEHMDLEYRGVRIDFHCKPLEQEPISETDIILTREEYGELVSSEYDNGYAKGYREALEQESVIDKIRADLYKLYNDRPSDYNHSQRTELFCEVIKILDKYKGESEG